MKRKTTVSKIKKTGIIKKDVPALVSKISTSISKINRHALLTSILLIALIGQTIYFQYRLNQQQTRLNEEWEKRQALIADFNTLKDATTAFYNEWGTQDDNNKNAILTTIDALEKSAEIQDKNVKIYDGNFELMEKRLGEHDEFWTKYNLNLEKQGKINDDLRNGIADAFEGLADHENRIKSVESR